MNALERLAAVAGIEAMPEGFAGYCVDCGRGRYRAWYAKEGQERGWVYAASVDKCFTCHRRPTRIVCPFCKEHGNDPTGVGVCSSCRKVWEGKWQRVARA